MRNPFLPLLLAATAFAGDPLRVEKDGVTLDLTGKVFRGAPEGTPPDRFEGIGLILDGRRNVTVKGGRFRGFRCAILVRNCTGVRLEGIDVSGNFRQRLKSTPAREDPSDWLWPHRNDDQEWRRNYGAGICLENCRDCVVVGCKGRNQQNGILFDRCRGCRAAENDMSFNSGWGIALWRSSDNVVEANKFDWCVRGYSHGVYDRGQDSAGILVFEQCNDNWFSHNSATHGGDGFFLFAGNETLKKTGKGGCNGNTVLGNDFSHAVANAIEATFSRNNQLLGNRCDDSNYGVWAGYSYDTQIGGNLFRQNSIAGVAIEHGMGNAIVHNVFERNPKGIQLWWDNDEGLLKSVFAKTHPCLSSGYDIRENTFSGDRVALFLRDTTAVRVGRNSYDEVEERLRQEGKCEVEPTDRKVVGGKPPGVRPGKAFLPEGHPRGRKHIMIDEWGPVDPTRHSVFPKQTTGWGACAFHVLGPAGAYDVKGLKEGLTVEKKGRTFRVRRGAGGGDGLTPFTCQVHVGGRVFPVRGLLLNATWRIRYWKWQEDKDPRKHPVEGEPLEEVTTDRLDYAWRNGAPAKGVPADRFFTRAETKMTLPEGRYEIRTVSDDGVRVTIDGRKVQEDWTWHGPTEHKTVVALEAGEHTIVVEHFEIDGWAVLRFDLRPVK